MLLSVLSEIEDMGMWEHFCSEKNIQLDPSYIFLDDSTPYNVRRVRKDNNILLVTACSNKYYEKFAASYAEYGNFPTIIMGSPMSYPFIDSYPPDIKSFDPDNTYPMIFDDRVYGVRTNGKFLVNKASASGSNLAFTTVSGRKYYGTRFYSRNLMLTNWVLSDNTRASYDLLFNLLKTFKGVA